MADEADMAAARMEWEEELRRKAKPKDELPFTGECYYCGEPVQEPRKWCSSDCREDFEFMEKMEGLNRGRA